MSLQTKEIVSKEKLIEAGVYYGHKTDKWNPKMASYIALTKKRTHFIDVEKTKKSLEYAYALIKNWAEKDFKFVFVGTRKQAKETIKANALRTNSFYVSERWLGGTLTNSRTIFSRVKRMDELEKLEATNFEGYKKKEALLLTKELRKLQKNLQGIREMRRRPHVMIVADPSADAIAIKEAKKFGIKIIGIVDTNNNPEDVTLAIPGNDDSIRSLTLIITLLADAIAEGKGGKTLFAHKSDEEIVLPEEPKREPRQRRWGNRPNNGFRRNNNFNKDGRNNNRDNSNRRPSNRKADDKKPAVKVDYESKTVAELKEIAKSKELSGYSALKKAELIEFIKNNGK